MTAKEAAFVEFLATMRRFRRFLLTAEVRVTVVHGAESPRGPIPIIENSDAHWDSVETALSRLRILEDVDGSVGQAAQRVIDAFYIVARERAANRPGAVSASVIEVSIAAEREFVRAARSDLGRGGSPFHTNRRLKAR
jgi:hypothetical protein